MYIVFKKEKICKKKCIDKRKYNVFSLYNSFTDLKISMHTLNFDQPNTNLQARLYIFEDTSKPTLISNLNTCSIWPQCFYLINTKS